MGFRVVDERTFQVGRPAMARRRLAARHGAGARRRRPADLGEAEGRAGSGFMVVMRGVAENDGYNALVLAAGLAGATSR